MECPWTGFNFCSNGESVIVKVIEIFYCALLLSKKKNIFYQFKYLL